MIAPEPDVLLEEPSGPILSYAEDRRSATPVVASHRLRILIAAAGLLVLLGIVLAVLCLAREHARHWHTLGRHFPSGHLRVR